MISTPYLPMPTLQTQFLQPHHSYPYKPFYQPLQPSFYHSYGPSYEFFEERVKYELDIEEIVAELQTHNYKRKFNNLICWEEMQNINILGQK